MMNTLHKKIFVLLLCTFASVPSMVFGAHVYVDTDIQPVSVGDTIIANVRVDSERTSVNLIEGSVNLHFPTSAIKIEDISVAGSALSLWVRKPSLSPDGQSVSFVGGAPGGFTTSNGIIFKIILTAKKAGTVTLTPAGILVYANDGKGTAVPTTKKSLNLSIKSAHPGVQPLNEWLTVAKEDKTPPLAFSVALGSDVSVYNGQKFIAFNTTDTDTGVDHYEITEGALPTVRSGNTYALQKQHSYEKITVVAYDKMNNTRTETYHTPLEIPQSLYIGIGILVLLSVSGIVLFFRKKR